MLPSRRYLWIPRLGLGLAVGLLGSACSASGPGTVAPPDATVSPSGVAPGGPGLPTVAIKDYAYQVSGTATAGRQVLLVNRDTVVHTVTLAGTGIDVTVPAEAETVTPAPARPGQYSIACDFHSTMHGQLAVS